MPGLLLAAAYCAIGLGWALCLSRLSQFGLQAGLPAATVAWLPMLFQLGAAAVHICVGVIADRTVRPGRPVVLAGIVAAVGFGWLPVAARHGAAGWFVLLLGMSAIAVSVLRVLPLVLIGRHAAGPSQSGLIVMSLFGLGLADTLSPELRTLLASVDPQPAFALGGTALALAALGIVTAGRGLSGAPRTAARAPDLPHPSCAWPFCAVLAAAFLMAAAAFEVHVSVNARQLYLRHAAPADLRYLAPVFWVGFGLFLLSAAPLVRRFGGLAVATAAAAVAGLVGLLAQAAGTLQMPLNLQFFCGAAWAGVLAGAFTTALAAGGPQRAGRFSAVLLSALALAALLRSSNGVVATAPVWLAGAAWWVAAAIGWAMWRQQRAEAAA